MSAELENVKEFANDILKKLQSIYPSAELSISEVRNNNDEILIGLAIKEAGGKIAPNIYINNLYEKYVSGKTDIDEVTLTIQRIYCDKKKEADRLNIDYNNLLSGDGLKSRVFLRLLGIDNNREYLRDAVYYSVCDNLAAVLYILMDMNDEGVATILFRKCNYEMLNIGKKELFDIALKNTVEFFPAELLSMKSLMQGKLDDFEYEAIPIDADMYVLSNRMFINGATAILYPNVLRDFCHEKRVNRLIILPSSVHETILFLPRFFMAKEELKEMVMDINEKLVRIEEVLSDDVYMYSLEDDKVHLL